MRTVAAEAVITGSGYAPGGSIRVGEETLHEPDPYGMTELLTAVALCNDARLVPPGAAVGEWAALGDPTEAAFLAAATKLGIDYAELQTRFPRCDERPFDSDRKRMTTVHRLADDRYRVSIVSGPCRSRWASDRRPLWEMWLVERLELGRWGIISKVHHCMSTASAAAT